MHGHGRGCCDTDTHLIALDPEHGHRDVIANLDGLADASRKNEHLKHRLVEHSAKYLTLFTRKQLRSLRSISNAGDRLLAKASSAAFAARFGGARGARWKIHAVGGRDTKSVGTHRVYDPATNRWSELAPLPQGRDHDSWSSAKPMPTARSGSAVAVMEGKIFVFGGERLGGTFNQAEVYDPAANVWAELAPMPMSVHGTGAVTISETIYIPAGATLNGGTAQTNGNQSFTLE
jgi:hypothetical protein